MEPTDIDTPELLRRSADGDEEAFVALYRRFQGGIYRFAWRMTGSREAAEDVTQETFLAIVRGPDRYEEARGAFGAYLYGIARNVLLKRAGRERAFVALGDGQDALRSSDDPTADLDRRQAVEAVRQAVLALPQHYREVVVLAELQGLPYEEVAGALACPVGTVRSRLHRARALLAQRLRGSGGSPRWTAVRGVAETV
jgi:RNA polymerase sigma-70 factor (ECF subfamily)